MLRGRSLRAVTVVGVVVVACLGGTATATAATSSTSDLSEPSVWRPVNYVLTQGKGKAAELSTGELQDAATLARDEGKTLAWAEDNFSGGTSWSAAVDNYRSAHEATYSNAIWRADIGDIPSLILTTKPNPDDLTAFDALPFKVKVYYGAPADSKTLEKLKAASLDSLNQISAVSGVSATSDPWSGAITVKYNRLSSTLDLNSLTTAVETAAAAEVGGRLPVPISLKAVEGAYHLYYAGGAALWSPTGSHVFQCTTGFNVMDNITGITGTLTAQHCGTSDFLWGESKQAGIIKWAAAAPDAPSAGKHIDVAAFQSQNGNVASANFQAVGPGSADRRTVSAAYNATVNQGICKWGWGAGHNPSKATHKDYACATVDNTDDCYTFDKATWCGENHTPTNIGNPGDSGGPVFRNTVAVGTVQAGSDDPGYGFLYVQQSRVGYIGSRNELSILNGSDG